jgi:hypothetical protein
MDPALLLIAIALLVGAAIAEAKRQSHQSPTRITGWWHYKHDDDGRSYRNDDLQWRSACDASLAKSQARRTGGGQDHH